MRDALRFSVSYMDTSADQGKDFYRYAVGKWIDNNPVPPDKTCWSSYYALDDHNLEIIHAIADACMADSLAAQGSYKRIVGDFYAAAMNRKRVEERRFSPINDLWDLISGIKSAGEVAAHLPRLHLATPTQRAGILAFFDSYSNADAKNNSVYAMHLRQGGLSLPNRDYYLLDAFAETRKEFRKHIKKMFMLKGVGKETAGNWSDMVLDFETGLARASRSSADLRDAEKNYNRVDLETLESRYPNLDLVGYLQGVGATGISYVVIGQPEFFDYLDEQLSTADIEKLRAYLYWNILRAYAPLLHDEVSNESFGFFGRKLMGQKQQAPMWKRAIYRMDVQIGEALGKLYVEKQFNEAIRIRVSELVNDLMESFRERLEGAKWMSEGTRRLALEKLSKMKVKIGHPAKFRDYSGIEIKRDDYAGNVRRSSEFEIRRQTSRAGHRIDIDEWTVPPQTVNAFHYAERNEIVLPAGILQPPYFDADIDDAVNYGAIGTLIGHEMTHGFDDHGRHYDPNGNMRDWWTKNDAKKFNEKAREVEIEYGSIEVLPGVQINGKLTLGENIADLGGVAIAYDALQKALARHSEKRRIIDGLTQEQRFFVSYAQIWRSSITEQELRRRLMMDPHAPERYRVEIPATNHLEFYKAFPPTARRAGSARSKRLGVW
ncbi:M13 family metallopeptidase [Candidatus Marsarchaeota archaeon]|nr:M13 family metallopeptidase [Candidatus Marsarchaeota archaeon]MCL5099909.1 M13 family metallopeptidase [Candidatus Marsarchaeota archaeon]